MRYVSDSVDISPPAEQTGLHPGAFTIDWSGAKVIRQTDNTTVNVPIEAQNSYSGVFFVNPSDSAAGTYETSVYQRLIVPMNNKNARHGAYIATIIPNDDHATSDVDVIDKSFYSGDLATKFSSVVMYSAVGSNLTMQLEQYFDGIRGGRSSVFGAAKDYINYPYDLKSMKSMLGAVRITNLTTVVTRARVEPPSEDNPTHMDTGPNELGDSGGGSDGEWDPHGNLDYPFSLDEVDVIGHIPSEDTSNSDTNDSHDMMDTQPPSSGDSYPGAVGSGGNGNVKDGKRPLGGNDSIVVVVSFIDSIQYNCGLKALFDASGGFGRLNGLYIDPNLGASGRYYPGTQTLSFLNMDAALGSDESVRMEEVLHYLQDQSGLYPGGITQYGKKVIKSSATQSSYFEIPPGNSNVEFEVKVLQDLYNKQKGKWLNNTGMGLEGYMGNTTQRKHYNDFLNNIIAGNYNTIESLNTAFYAILKELAGYFISLYPGEILTNLPPYLLDAYGEQIATNDCDE